MCRIDGSEMVTVLSSGERKARKKHECSECRRSISAGEIYHSEATTFEGYFDTYKTCAHCMVARLWLVKNCGGFIYAEVIDEIAEHGVDYPDLREPLCSLASAARKKWTVGDLLMPIPEMPPPIQVHH